MRTYHSTFCQNLCQNNFYLSSSFPPCLEPSVVVKQLPVRPFSCALRGSLRPTGGSWRRPPQPPPHSTARGLNHPRPETKSTCSKRLHPVSWRFGRQPPPIIITQNHVSKSSSLHCWKLHVCTLHGKDLSHFQHDRLNSFQCSFFIMTKLLINRCLKVKIKSLCIDQLKSLSTYGNLS